jgi:heme O synthase-like polyprenyltransferase
MTVNASLESPSPLRQFYALTKPRVIQLIVFCALIGMVLAVPGAPTWAQVGRALIACFGIYLVAGAAAAFNCIVEKGIDAKMKRTAWRPTARGELGDGQTLLFSAVLCTAGSAVLYLWVNPLTMWLTFATFVGYAVVYTVMLPFVYGMSSWLYLGVAVILSVGFCVYAWRLLRNYSDELSRKTFRFSLIHLSALFAALLLDHYLI